MAELAGLPKDVIYGIPLVTMVGQSEVSVENYRGILEYTEKIIRIQTKLGKIHIHGTCLQIEYYNNDEMKITGHITEVEFHEGG